MKLKTTLMLAALLFCGAAAATEKDTFGMHLGTYHSPNIDCSNGKNPGLYYINGDTGLTIGTYYNSCKRQTEYIGWKSPSLYGLSLMAGGATGYRKPVTVMMAPTAAFGVTKNTSLRITGGSWEGMDVYHLSIERKF